MRAPEDIIIRPFITEKSNEEVAAGKYTFVVDVNATKTEIRQAAEKLFQVKVLAVNTAKYKGKKREWASTSETGPTGRKQLSR